jgi:Putative peptidoglycan binding domain
VTSFPLTDAPYKYRPLKKGMSGWDVYALQSALIGAGLYRKTDGSPRALDGLFGDGTHEAVRDWQTASALTVDGIAGIVTQRTLAIKDMAAISKKYSLPSGALKGQVEAESAFQLGNHSVKYSIPVSPSYAWDAGVTQRSSRYTPLDEGFHAPRSLEVLGKQIRAKYNEYKALGVVKNERRLWELAQGSWNAPAWTDRLARGGTLPAANKEWIEDYIDRVTVYLVV